MKLQGKEFFDGMEKIMPFYQQLITTGKIDFGVIENRALVGELFLMLYPTAMIDMSCDTCIKNQMHYLVAYYERELPVYIKTQQESQAVPVETPLSTIANYNDEDITVSVKTDNEELTAKVKSGETKTLKPKRTSKKNGK